MLIMTLPNAQPDAALSQYDAARYAAQQEANAYWREKIQKESRRLASRIVPAVNTGHSGIHFSTGFFGLIQAEYSTNVVDELVSEINKLLTTEGIVVAYVGDGKDQYEGFTHFLMVVQIGDRIIEHSDYVKRSMQREYSDPGRMVDPLAQQALVAAGIMKEIAEPDFT